jgi:hypothetical protein
MQAKEEGEVKFKEVKVREPTISPEERLYITSYFANNLSHSEAHKAILGVKKGKNDNPFSKRENIQYHIRKELIKQSESLSLNGDKVLKLLLEEATRLGKGSSPTARVQALQLLGKHLGLFEEKEEDKSINFNIINYNTPPISSPQEVVEPEKHEENILTELPSESVNEDIPIIKLEDYNERE